MHLYFDKLGILKTIIPHGEIPRQGSTLNIYVCFDEDFFETEEEKQKHSVNIDLILPNNEVVTKNMVPVKPAYMSLFMPVSSSEVTYDFVPGVEYLTYHFEFEPEQATPIAGRVIANISVVEIEENEEEEDEEKKLKDNTIYFGRAEIFIEKTFGNAKVVVNDASLHYKNLIRQINLLNERMVSTNGTQIISGAKTFTAPVNIKSDLQLQNISSSDLIDENTACIHIYNKETEDKYKVEFRQSDGVVALLSDLDDFVTKSSTQTISGQKTYTGTQDFYGAVNLNSIVNFKYVEDIDNENGQRGAYFYVRDEEDNDAEYKLYFQCKDGVIALKSDLAKINDIEQTSELKFYAPTSKGENEFLLTATGTGAPIWVDPKEIEVGTAGKAILDGIGQNIVSTYLSKTDAEGKYQPKGEYLTELPSNPTFKEIVLNNGTTSLTLWSEGNERLGINEIYAYQDIYSEGNVKSEQILEGRVLKENGVELKDKYATPNYVNQKIADLVNSAPEALNTLGELATALENHEDAYDALLETVGKKADSTSVYTIKEIDDKIGEIDSILDTFNGEVI